MNTPRISKFMVQQDDLPIVEIELHIDEDKTPLLISSIDLNLFDNGETSEEPPGSDGGLTAFDLEFLEELRRLAILYNERTNTKIVRIEFDYEVDEE